VHLWNLSRGFLPPGVIISLLSCEAGNGRDTNRLCDLNPNLRRANIRLIKVLDSSLRILWRLEANVTYPSMRDQARICDIILLCEVRAELGVGEGGGKPADEYSCRPVEYERRDWGRVECEKELRTFERLWWWKGGSCGGG